MTTITLYSKIHATITYSLKLAAATCLMKLLIHKEQDFLQYQLVASDLSGGLECTKEFEDSIVMVKNITDGTRYSNGLSDATSFMFNVQCERNNAGYTFDWFDSNGQNVPIQLKGNPIYTGLNDTYYNVDENGTAHPPPP